MNNSCPLNIKFNFFPMLKKKSVASISNVNLRQFSLLNILFLFLVLTYFILLNLIAIIHLFQVSCILSSLVVSCQVNLFFKDQFSSHITLLLFVLHVNHVALKIFFEYSRKI